MKRRPVLFFATAGYASPEQCAGKTCDARSDTYSLGATLYHLITGERPKDLSGFSLKKIKPRISIYMDRVINKARSIYVKERYQTAEEFKYDLMLWKDPFSLVESDKGFSEGDLLIVQLKAKDTRATLNAIKSLARVRDRKVTSAIIKMLSSENIKVQQRAAALLGEIGDSIALDSLLELIRSGNRKLYKTAIESIEKINWADNERFLFIALKIYLTIETAGFVCLHFHSNANLIIQVFIIIL